jgi:hypothetical protein
MSDPLRVEVRERIRVTTTSGSEVWVDPGIFEASFLRSFIGPEDYAQAKAAGHLVEGVSP